MISRPMNIRNVLSTTAWCMAIVGYYFQFPIPQLSSLIVPGVILYIALELPNLYIPKKKCYLLGLVVYLLLLVICVVRSLLIGVSFSRIIRFAAILTLIPVSCWVYDPNFLIKKMLFYLLYIQVSDLILQRFPIRIQIQILKIETWADLVFIS